MGGYGLPNPTQDMDPGQSMKSLLALLQAFGSRPLAPQGPQPPSSEAQTKEAMRLAEEVAAAHAASGAGGDVEKFKADFEKRFKDYSTPDARVGSVPLEAAYGGYSALQGAKGLYSLGRAAVNGASKLGLPKAVSRMAGDTKGELDPEKMMEFLKTTKDLPKEWRERLEKELAFKILKKKDPFALSKPVPLGPPSGSNAATALGRKDWPELLAKSRSASAPQVPPAAPPMTPPAGAVGAGTSAAAEGAAQGPTWAQRLVQSRAKDAPVQGPAQMATKEVGVAQEAAPDALRVLGKQAPGAARPEMFFDATAPLSPKEGAAILNGIRQAIPRLYESPAKSGQLMSRLENVQRYMATLGPKATKMDLLAELRKQGMLTKSAYEVMKKMGYTGIKEAWVEKGSPIKRFADIMNPAFDASEKLK